MFYKNRKRYLIVTINFYTHFFDTTYFYTPTFNYLVTKIRNFIIKIRTKLTFKSDHSELEFGKIQAKAYVKKHLLTVISTFSLASIKRSSKSRITYSQVWNKPPTPTTPGTIKTILLRNPYPPSYYLYYLCPKLRSERFQNTGVSRLMAK